MQQFGASMFYIDIDIDIENEYILHNYIVLAIFGKNYQS